MKTNDFQKFLLKSAVTAMACDGSIDDKEIAEINNMARNEIYFMGYDIAQPLLDSVDYLKTNGTQAINEFLNDLSVVDLNARQELLLIEVLIRTIESDDTIEDNEMTFLQLVVSKLKTNKETIITKFPKYISSLIYVKAQDSPKEFTEEIELS